MTNTVDCPLSSRCKDIREYSTHPNNRRMDLSAILSLIETVSARSDLSGLAHTCLDANGAMCWLSADKKEVTDKDIKLALKNIVP